MDLEIMLKRPQLDDTQDGRPQRVGVGESAERGTELGTRESRKCIIAAKGV